MAILRLFWLGPPSIEYDGRPLRLEMRKALALLAYISLSPQSPTRETLATLFWPEFDQQRALSNLRRNLSSLNKSLPAGSLDSDREIIGLVKGALRIDVEDFENYLAFVDHHAHPLDQPCLECMASLEKALSIYHGDFFQGFNLKDCPDFDEWQLLQRENLRAKYAGALKKLVDFFQNQSEWEKALGYARLWLALDRLNEPAQRTLITLLSHSGQRWAAIRQYEEFVELLRSEVKQEPEAETIELFRTLQGENLASQKPSSRHLILEPIQTPSLEPLLKTKFYIPFSKGKKVFRERLLSKLNQIPDHPLTILSAPAGFGKTTALSEWIKQNSLPVGWLSLDDADNHQVRFFTYLISALQGVESDFEKEFQGFLQSPQPLRTEVVVTKLVHGFERMSFPFVLVLDDYQHIRAEPIHEFLALLLQYLPANAHLVISTRVDPPLSLGRLRAAGKLLEIRAQELRFTPEETYYYLNEIMGLDISPSDIAVLDERTEGWAVGLQMAALSLQKSTDRSQTIKAFSGSNRYILDYLVEEVVERQPKFVQDFLLQTSFLKRMSGPLCDAVTGIREWNIESEEPYSISKLPLSSQQILEYLEHVNLFVLSLDDERYWYRYHHLFAELLAARLENFYPQLVDNLNRRASEWHEQNSFIPDAVRYALASKSYAYAANVIERAIRTNIIWGTGDLPLLFSWVDALPEDVLFLNPLLRLYLCATLYTSGQFNKSIQILDELENLLPEILKSVPNPVLVEQTYLAFRILHEAIRGNISRAMDYFHRSEIISNGDERMKTLSKNYVMLAYYVAGDVETVLRISLPSYETMVSRGNTLSAVNNVKSIADVYILQGRFTDAIELCQQAIESCKLNGLKNPIVGILAIPLGTILLERNELEAAENYVQEGLDLLAKGTIRSDFGQLYALYAMIKQAQGDQKRALQLMTTALHIAENAAIPRIIDLLQAYQAHIWLAQGEIEFASNWASAYQLHEITEYPREVEDITLARVLILQKRYTEACALLEVLSSKAHHAGRKGRLIGIRALLSMVYYMQDRINEALKLLQEFLELVRSERYVRVFLDEGEPMRALLELYKELCYAENNNVRRGTDGLIKYVDQLLLTFESG